MAETSLSGSELIVLIGACRAVLLESPAPCHAYAVTLRAALRKLEAMAGVEPSDEGKEPTDG